MKVTIYADTLDDAIDVMKSLKEDSPGITDEIAESSIGDTIIFWAGEIEV